MTVTFLDLFGAPGGMSLGFKLAGMSPVGVFDAFKAGIRTYARNFPDVPRENVACMDLSSNDMVGRIARETSLRPGDVDVLIGGPPCQGFSIVGRTKIASLAKNGQRNGSTDARFIDDSRNDLYKSFVSLVRHFKPRMIVMENVTGMMSYKNGKVVGQIEKDLAGVGYGDVVHGVLNAADFGVPQIRRRIFFVASIDGSMFEWPAPTHRNSGSDASQQGVQKYVTVMDAIGDLPYIRLPKKNLKLIDSVKKYKKEPACDYQRWVRGNAEKVSSNITRWHRRKDIEVFGHMKQGSKWSDLSNEDRQKIGYSNNSFNDKWKRLDSKKPSWTVTSHLSRDGYMYIHPRQNRTISVREAARLQSFPDWFKFEGSRGAQFRQIGNAVPPLLAKALAKSVMRTLRKQ